MFTGDQFDEAMRLTYEFNEPHNLSALRRFRALDMRLLKRYLDAGRALREAFDGLHLYFTRLPVGRCGCEAALAIELYPTEEVLFVVMDETADHEGLGFAPWAVLLPGEHKQIVSRWFDNPIDALRDYLTDAQGRLKAHMVTAKLVEATFAEMATLVGAPASLPVSRFLPDGTIVYRGGLYNEATFPKLGGVLVYGMPSEDLHFMMREEGASDAEAKTRAESGEGA